MPVPRVEFWSPLSPQASQEELLGGLAALRAVRLADGTWRRVEGEYLGSLLELIMVR